MTDAIVTPAVPTPRVPAGAPASRQDLRTGDGQELAVVLPAEQPRRHSAQVRGLALLSDDAPKDVT
ncbi:MAG TPA: hypothetical protein VKP11_08875, partial [Frankiaceae bacterium]|nr:hypothetical protein [Frankiaceae bacterium]